jgi:hypothetical protein
MMGCERGVCRFFRLVAARAAALRRALFALLIRAAAAVNSLYI